MAAEPRSEAAAARHRRAVERAERALRDLDWIHDVEVRLREEGHIFAGEAHVVPVSDQDLTGRLEEAAERLLGLDWRLHDVIVAPATADGLRKLRPRG